MFYRNAVCGGKVVPEIKGLTKRQTPQSLFLNDLLLVFTLESGRNWSKVPFLSMGSPSLLGAVTWTQFTNVYEQLSIVLGQIDEIIMTKLGDTGD